MVIVKLKGGLGNQMFQYAYARAIAEKNAVHVKLDATYYFNREYRAVDVPRYYLLNHFNIALDLATPEEVASFRTLPRRVYWKIKTKLFGHANAYTFFPKDLKVKDWRYQEGYWQSEKYFLPITSSIRKELSLKDTWGTEAQKIVNEIDTVQKQGQMAISLHVRRSDYLSIKANFNFFGVCDITYYERAWKSLTEAMEAKQKGSSDTSHIHVFVFSDDIAWAKENISFPATMHFVSRPGIEDYEELSLMSLCNHHIIANSTFSWWGAWLNTKQDKIIVAPKQWVAQKVDTSDALPESWIKV